MDSLTRYHLSPHEEGTWNVIDATTGGPAEVLVEGYCSLLYRLPRETAEGWSLSLNREAGMFRHKNLKRQDRE